MGHRIPIRDLGGIFYFVCLRGDILSLFVSYSLVVVKIADSNSDGYNICIEYPFH